VLVLDAELVVLLVLVESVETVLDLLVEVEVELFEVVVTLVLVLLVVLVAVTVAGTVPPTLTIAELSGANQSLARIVFPASFG
jgi:hypothetical protein